MVQAMAELGPAAMARSAATLPLSKSWSRNDWACVYTASATLGQPGPLSNDPSTAIADNGSPPAAQGNPSLPHSLRKRGSQATIAR